MSELDPNPVSPDQPGVLVIGAGLIGTSIALALTEHGHRVHLADRTPSHALVAAGLGAGTIDPPTNIGLVIVAVPPSVCGKVVVKALKKYPGATVTDVASVKAPVLAAVLAQGGDVARYVGSHPMAGSHRSGPLTARADLFVDRTWVIAAHDGADPASVAKVRALAQLCGSQIEVMDPHEHDLAVAEVSHVPQIVSSLMAGNLADVAPAHLRLAGQGVRDVTRIAASDETMWTQIITANREAIGVRLDELSAALDNIRTQLDSPQVVAQFIRDGIQGTKTLPGKHGRLPEDYQYLVVEIPDSPGALARLFADVGAAGVSVEDLRLEHDPAREVGFLSIAVEPDQAETLMGLMRQAGWSVTEAAG